MQGATACFGSVNGDRSSVRPELRTLCGQAKPAGAACLVDSYASGDSRPIIVEAALAIVAGLLVVSADLTRGSRTPELTVYYACEACRSPSLALRVTSLDLVI